MMGFIDDDEVKLLLRHPVFSSGRHEGLYRCHLNNLFQLQRVSTHYYATINSTLSKLICCLLYQFSDVGKNEYV